MSVDTLTTCAAAAVAYRRIGWNVLPIDPASKKALVPWKAYQTARQAVALVESWWSRWPAANVAVITGAVSGVVVLDVDGEQGRANLSALGAPPDWTPRVRTRKGHHYYLRHPGYLTAPWANPEDLKRIPPHLRGLDFRGDGGYVIAPPSVHATGHVYAWEVAPDGL